MRKIKYKNSRLRIVACFAIAILALSSIYIPKVSAAESYFTAEGGTLAIDEVRPDQRTIWVKLKAAREMTIHSLEGYFTPVDNDEELEYGFGDISAVFPGMGGNRCSLSDGWFYWSAEEFMDQSISSEGIHVQAGDAIFEVAYDVKAGVELLRRNMPVKVELAVIDDGTEIGKRIQNVTMDAYAIAGHDISVYKYITGNGDLDVPSIVIGGTDVEVGIVPDSDYELTYLELNGQEVTDQVKNNVYKTVAGTESLTFYATFRRVYRVLEGDGGEHILGSDGVLAFKIDNDVTEFCGTGVLIIDGEYLDMRTDCEVDPDNQTIVLPANLLNTLGIGEHTFEAWFSEPETGSARATFKIVEENKEAEEDDKKEDDKNDNDGNKEESQNKDEGQNKDDSEDVPVPNTGAFTNQGGSTKTVGNTVVPVAIAGIIGAITTTTILIKRMRRR